MRQVMVRYRVLPERAEENEAYIRAVFAELERRRPQGLEYASFKLEDGVSFVHLATIAGADNPLLALEAFREFTADIKSRCAEPPVTLALSAIGSYRALAEGATE
jgi:hypothetical protein